MLGPPNTGRLYVHAWPSGVALRSIVPATNMNRRWTLQQCIFVCKCYFKWESPSRVRTDCIQMFHGEVPPSRFTIHEIVKKFETTGSVANKKRNLNVQF